MTASAFQQCCLPLRINTWHATHIKIKSGTKLLKSTVPKAKLFRLTLSGIVSFSFILSVAQLFCFVWRDKIKLVQSWRAFFIHLLCQRRRNGELLSTFFVPAKGLFNTKLKRQAIHQIQRRAQIYSKMQPILDGSCLSQDKSKVSLLPLNFW